MKHPKKYVIPFKGLKLGEHQFDYIIEKEFFDAFKYDDFIESHVEITLDFHKKSTLFELFFSAKGTVLINCDVSGEEYNQPIEGSLKLIVNFGEEFNDDHDEILVIPHHSYELDISQYIYELIVLSVPVKRIHPNILDGTLESKAIQKLEELQNKVKTNTDPRWEKLKSLINDKN